MKPQLQIQLQRAFVDFLNVRKLLILMVGAGRFERPTPCAQGGFRHSSEMACFLVLGFQAVMVMLLQLEEMRGAWRLSQLHFYLHTWTNGDQSPVRSPQFWTLWRLKRVSRVASLCLTSSSTP